MTYASLTLHDPGVVVAARRRAHVSFAMGSGSGLRLAVGCFTNYYYQLRGCLVVLAEWNLAKDSLLIGTACRDLIGRNYKGA